MEGIPCMLVPVCNSSEKFKDYDQLSKHLKSDFHNLSGELIKAKSVKYKCRHENCASQKELGGPQFNIHNQKKHGFSKFCLDCDEIVAFDELEKHLDKDENEHSFIELWTFKPLTWPAIDSR